MGEARRLNLHMPVEDQDSLEKIVNLLDSMYRQAVTLEDPRALFICRKICYAIYNVTTRHSNRDGPHAHRTFFLLWMPFLQEWKKQLK